MTTPPTFRFEGEPATCSMYTVWGDRKPSSRYYHSSLWGPKLLTCMQRVTPTGEPVALFLRFYLTPPDWVVMTPADLRSEQVPALYALEVLDYTMGVIYTIKETLLHSYAQIIKIDCEKYYSTEPRTEMWLMTWSEYVRDGNPLKPPTKEFTKSRKKRLLQPNSEVHEGSRQPPAKRRSSPHA